MHINEDTVDPERKATKFDDETLYPRRLLIVDYIDEAKARET